MGNLITAWRGLYDVSQRELAQAVGIHPKALSRIENGAEPTFANALKICDALSAFARPRRKAAAAAKEQKQLQAVARYKLPEPVAKVFRDSLREISPLNLAVEHVFYRDDDSAAWRAYGRAHNDLAMLRDLD